MVEIRSICVFCGSSLGDREIYRQQAQILGETIARHDIELIYGGAHVGLMGIVADAALAANGVVTGIIPTMLRRVEVAHQGLTHMIEVETMFARKAVMIERADAFVSLPGGIGTVDEMMEVVTLRLLGLHAKPSILVDVEGYWSGLTAMFDGLVAHRFAPETIREFYSLVPDAESVLPALGVAATT